ncbi:MAG: MarR family winged helix-turn-helix transcriptional regulator [Deltaproteobacteria bacterium]|jgi:DNA-binding MarR family transcriptional regulator|nr:MarR family winged helix-turn-helix transcriptional regulator [Deltaproteobacteria bacterium]
MGQEISSEKIRNELAEEVLVTIRQIIQAIDMHSRTLVKEYGLTAPQLVILKTVAKEKAITVGSIAKKVSLSQATVTGIIERLVQRSLVLRNRSSKDRRRVIIEPTPQCYALLDKAPPLMQEVFVNQFCDLDEWERLMLLSSLKKIVKLMNVKPPQSASPYLVTGEVEPDPKN